MNELIQRRAAMMQSRGGGDGYITDGLVFHLDGINKGTTDPTKWVDLVGGVIFTNNGAINEATYWQFNNTTSTYLGLRNDDDLSFPFSTHTIEVCFDKEKANVVVFVLKNSDNIAFGMEGGHIVWTMRTQRDRWSAANASLGVHTFSISSESALQDARYNLTKDSITDAWNLSAYNGIGYRSNNANFQFNGKIFAIRIYNRLLTEDEMRHNQRVDNERFDLGLDIQ
jgi:hypothetical protein